MARRTIPALNLPLVLTVISWALNFPALKILYLDVRPPAVSLIRFVAMYAVLLLICRMKGWSLKPDKEDVPKVIWLGFVSMGIYMILFLEGMNRTSANEGAIILASCPIITGLLAVGFKQERFSIGAFLGAIVGFVGVVLVIYEGARSSGTLHGDLIVFLSAILWAYSAVLMRALLGRYEPVQLLTMAMPGALIALLPYGAREVLHTDWAAVHPISWLFIGHLAVLSGALGFAAFYMGVRQIGAGGAMLYQYFVPPCTVLFAWLLLGQRLLPLQGIGMAVVIGGVAISLHFREAARLTAETRAV